MPSVLRTLALLLASAVALGGQAPPHASTAGLGRISFPNSGSLAAQAPFVRGVLLLHSFEYDDAIEAFREAERIDPGFALAYWGEALCFDQPLWRNENLEKARAALTRLGPTAAARAARAPTEREKGYLAAVDALFGAGDRAARLRAYVDRMASMAARFPDDDEASAFYALALLATIPEGERNPPIALKAGAIASAVLDRNPVHPGAAHYALHAYDDGEHAAMGLKAARVYARIAPASSHALHMPSHVFLPLGMWDEAASSDEASFAASVARVKRKGLSIAQADFHSLTWLHYEYLQQGRYAKARGLEATVQEAIAAGAAAHVGHAVESEIGRGFSASSLKSELASMRARAVLEAGDWTRMKGQGSFDNIDELFSLGYSAARLGDGPRAEAALENLLQAAQTVSDRDARELSDIMAAELAGALQVARGDRANGLRLLSKAVEMEAGRPKPVAKPFPVKPAAELYGEALLEIGEARRAVDEFHRALARTPNRALSLLGLARAAKAAGVQGESRRAARALAAVWHQAEPGRSELNEVRLLAR